MTMTPEEHAESVCGEVLSCDAVYEGEIACRREDLAPLVVAAIREAVDAERERCAQLVEGFADEWREDVPKLTVTWIACAIRESKQ